MSTDSDRYSFLKALDKSDVDVGDWEARFIESNLEVRRAWDERPFRRGP
jgi:hypothetical protein